jgi:simple sugar transport system permease protein
VVLAALFVAGVFVGADSMSRTAGVPSYIADLVVALSLLTMLLAGLATRYRVRRRARLSTSCSRRASGRRPCGSPRR